MSHSYHKPKKANGREISGRRWEPFPAGEVLRLQGDRCPCSLTCLALTELLVEQRLLSNGMERPSWSAGGSWHSFSKRWRQQAVQRICIWLSLLLTG